MNIEPSSEPGAGAAQEMRAALRSRIGERLRAGVRRSTPQALMAALAASAYAPLLIGGNTDSALVLTGAAGASVGANAISEILQQGVDRLRGRKPTLQEMEDWLAERFEDLLARQDRQAMVLQGQLAVIFSRIGASEAALEAAMETGGQALRAELAADLAQLDARFGAVGAALGVMDLKLDEIRRDVGVLRHAAGRQYVPEPARVTSPAGVPLAQVTDPFLFEVHRAIGTPAGAAGLPPLPAYVPREHDVRLAEVVSDAAVGTSGIAVLVGGSSTGKTRACWEALRPLRERSVPWRLWHPIDPTRPDAALVDLARVGPYTVIWLNEAQFYLDPSTGDLGERLAAGLRSLLRDADRGPVLIMATLWPAYWTTLTTQPGRTEPDVHAQARELLDGQAITVPEAFTDADLDGLDARSRQDLRLAEAADGAQDGQITQYLAGVPVLLDRYRNAEPATKALIQAAMDARRFGCGPHLPRALLAAAVPSYLTETEWHRTADDWLPAALDYAARPCNGIPGILTPVKPGSARDHRPAPAGSHQSTEPPSGPNHRLADYLDQHGRRHRREHIPPIGFWTALAAYAHPGDLSALAKAAWDRGLFRDAAQLWKNAVTSGDLTGAAKLIDLMRFRHPADHRPAQWAAAQIPLDDAGGVARLVRSLSEVGEGEQAAVLLARDPAGHVRLDDADGVARLLESLRDLGAEEQVAVLLARDPAGHARPGDPAVAELLYALRKVGARQQVEALAWRVASQAPTDQSGDLMYLLQCLGAVDAREQFEELARRAAARVLDDPHDMDWMVPVLRHTGAKDQATALARHATAHVSDDDPPAVRDPAAHAALDDAYAVMPAVGLFAKFMVFDENRERFKFGREPDGAAAPRWGWDDLA